MSIEKKIFISNELRREKKKQKKRKKKKMRASFRVI